MEFEVKTPSNHVKVEVYSGFIDKKEIRTDRKLFSEMCKKCRNYNKKYSCPPKSPDFNLICSKEGLFIVLFKISLSQISSTEYNKVQIASSILKSRIDRLMRLLEEKLKTKYLTSGSCRLCKPCCLEKNLPCKHPEKMRFSLESTGIDCNFISEKLFKFPLLWFKNKKAPEYACALAGLISDKKDKETIESELIRTINETFY